MTPLEVLNLGRFETGDCALTSVDSESRIEYDEALDAVACMKPWTFLRKQVRLREDDVTLGVTQSTCPEEFVYPLPDDYASVLRVWNDRCKPAKYRIINCELRTPERDIVVTYTATPLFGDHLVLPEKVGRLLSLYIAMVRSLSVNKSIAMYGKNRSLFKTLIENIGGNDEMQEPAREVFDSQYLVGKFSGGVCCGLPLITEEEEEEDEDD